MQSAAASAGHRVCFNMVNRVLLTRSVKSKQCQQDGSEIAKESGQRLAPILKHILKHKDLGSSTGTFSISASVFQYGKNLGAVAGYGDPLQGS